MRLVVGFQRVIHEADQFFLFALLVVNHLTLWLSVEELHRLAITWQDLWADVEDVRSDRLHHFVESILLAGVSISIQNRTRDLADPHESYMFNDLEIGDGSIYEALQQVQ